VAGRDFYLREEDGQDGAPGWNLPHGSFSQLAGLRIARERLHYSKESFELFLAVVAYFEVSLDQRHKIVYILAALQRLYKLVD
jgi:hypothetical protein